MDLNLIVFSSWWETGEASFFPLTATFLWKIIFPSEESFHSCPTPPGINSYMCRITTIPVVILLLFLTMFLGTGIELVRMW